ncbi:phospholipase D3 [Heterostelium album PN500]|uniref:Phospholipase D3 n=1 Tax=Heterostelium pallidum (strain ATCC 26659 / Pp 5 / PN500) TaxID=670386 RepID=D3B1H4_HETP5|nr:phospholipase D3 [Heterostelium album PN500]EFA85148.1 phospholipase D3 [Heterostelium album PN500]|eukprot:XP_020437257.1 phospholipase D3 [Heterostelium album PN500]
MIQIKSSLSIVLLVSLLCVCTLSKSVSINNDSFDDKQCSSGRMYIAESIPVYVNLTTNITTYEAWMNLINNAQESIDLGLFYMTLTDGADYPSIYGGYMGMDFYKALINAAQRGVTIRIVQNLPSASQPANDTTNLANMGVAQVRTINWPSLVGNGILHTKMIVVDKTNAYVGSANFDWRSLAQVKELGVVVENCKTLVEDTKIAFEQYWDAAIMTQLPSKWPSKDKAKFNATHPAQLQLNGEAVSMFLAVSPPQFVSKDRTGDIDALVAAINAANQSVCISVMDYAPSSFYNYPNTFWPVIDDALRAAAYNRRVQVRVMVSHWNHTNTKIIPQFLHSLAQVNNIQVRWFQVPDMPVQPQVPYSRVNHAKYMVTEQQSYVGTSNWSQDYFTNTGGLSYNIFNADFTSQLQSIFDRDWNSQYTFPVTTCDSFIQQIANTSSSVRLEYNH